jgi:hypothetical protein
VAGSWRGTARPGRGSGAAVARLSGGAARLGARLSLTVQARTHAHRSWLPRAAAFRAVHGAPAFRARNTMRRRRATAAAGCDERHDGSLHKSGTMAGWGKGALGIIGGSWLTLAAEVIGEAAVMLTSGLAG